MSTRGEAFHRRKRSKYSDDDIAHMEHMRFVEKKSLSEIGQEFGVSGRAIETQLNERGNY